MGSKVNSRRHYESYDRKYGGIHDGIYNTLYCKLHIENFGYISHSSEV